MVAKLTEQPSDRWHFRTKKEGTFYMADKKNSTNKTEKTGKPIKRRQMKPATLYSNISTYIDTNGLSVEATVDQLLDTLKDRIVSDAVAKLER